MKDEDHEIAELLVPLERRAQLLLPFGQAVAWS